MDLQALEQFLTQQQRRVLGKLRFTKGKKVVMKNDLIGYKNVILKIAELLQASD
jgi:hypothetical protein